MTQFALTDKVKTFVAEYMVDFNATHAYQRVNPNVADNTARSAASRLMAQPEVQELVAQAMKDRLQRIALTVERVDQEIARLALSDVRKLYNPDGTLKPIHELDDDSAAALASVEVTEIAGMPMSVRKVKTYDKVAALTLAAKRLGILTEKLSVGGATDLPPISIQEAARRVAFTLHAGLIDKRKRDALGS